MASTDTFYDIWAMRRMREMSRAPDVPPTLALDISHDSDLNEDHVEEAASDFGAVHGQTGWGLSEVFNDLISSQPNKIASRDLRDLQGNLIARGYASPDTPLDGIWSPEWANNMRRADRDAAELQLSGFHALSTPLMSGLRFIGNVLPGAVYQGIIGSAKGLIAEAPVAAERLGVGGGALAGAGLGAAVGASAAPFTLGISVLVGAGIGAIGGFLGEVFGSDKGEDPNRNGLWDLLTPFDEYSGEGGSQRMLQDLGFVLSAASILYGGAEATAGVKAGLASIGEQGGLLQALKAGPSLAREAAAAGDVVRPGLLTKTASRLIPGEAKTSFLDWVGTHGLGAMKEFNPVLRTIDAAYTGASSIQMSARYLGGLGGQADLYMDQGQRIKDRQGTPLAEAIESAPDLGTAGTVLDWTVGMVLTPSRFFALGPGDAAKGVAAVFSPDTTAPYRMVMESVQRDPITGDIVAHAPSHTQAETMVREMLGHEPSVAATSDLMLRVNHGIYRDAEAYASEMSGLEAGKSYRRLIAERSAETRRNILDEWSNGEATTSNKMIAYSQPAAENPLWGPDLYSGWLKGLEGRGSGFDRMKGWKDSLNDAEQVAKDFYEDPSILTIEGQAWQGYKPTAFQQAEAKVSKLESDIEGLTERARTEKMPKAREGFQRRLDKARADLEDAKVNMPEPADDLEPLRAGSFVPVRNVEYEGDSALSTIDHIRAGTRTAGNQGGYTSQQEFGAFSETLDKEANDLRNLRKRLEKAEGSEKSTPETLASLRAEIDQKWGVWLDHSDDLALRKVLSPSQLEKMRDPLQGASKTNVKKLTEHFKEEGSFAGREVSGINEEVAGRLSQRGYRLAATNEDMLMFSDIPKNLDGFNIRDWAAEPSRWETIRDSLSYGFRTAGLDFNPRTNRGLFRLRMAHEEAELHQVLAREGIKMSGAEARKQIGDFLMDYNHGKGVTFEAGQGVVAGPGRVYRNAEGKLKFSLYKLDVRELKTDHIVDALKLDDPMGAGRFLGDKDPYRVADKIYEALHRGATLGGEVDFVHPMDTLRMIGKATRAQGLSGFADFARTLHYSDPRLFYGAVGAAAGAEIEREQGAGAAGILGGAAVGGAGGAAFGQFRGARNLKKIDRLKAARDMEIAKPSTLKSLLNQKFDVGQYGYLADKAHRLHMALRYSFSLAFDAGRYMEQNLLAREHGLPVIFSPRSYITRNYGADAWGEATQYFDHIQGGRMMQVLDDIDRRAFQQGLAGFSPRLHEAAQAYILKNTTNWSDQRIFAEVTKIGGYGLGRSAAEKSVNFVFFPFSFQKKLIASLGNFLTQAPARNLLIYEGLRAFTGLQDDGTRSENPMSTKVGNFIDRHAPFLQQLQFLNNLAFGISPGRFFLEGAADRKSELGLASELIATGLGPGGVGTPLAQMFGGAADALVHAFIPVVVTDQTPEQELFDVFKKYTPLVREVQHTFIEAGGQQLQALTSPGFKAPYAQLTDYLDGKREALAQYEPMAKALGYASAESFLNSDAGASLKPQYDQDLLRLRTDNPLGFQKSQEFTNTTAINQNMIATLANKPDRTKAEDAVVTLSEIQQQGAILSQYLGLPEDQIKGFVQSSMRQEAMKHINDKEFLGYWARFFQTEFGPLETVAA